jgi:hypothetical protein
MVKNTTNFFSKTAPRSDGMMEDSPVVGCFHHNMLCFAPAKEDYMDSLSYHFVGTMTCQNGGGLKSQT